MNSFWIGLGCSFALTGLLAPVLRRVAVIDAPNERSLHSTAIPRGGGAAVLVAVLAAVVLTGGADRAEMGLLAGAALALGAVGLVDDVRSLPPVFRLATQLLVAIVTVATVTRLVGDAGLWVPVFFAGGTIGLVAYVNAFNFMDGVNGISALNAAVCGAWLAWLGHEYGQAALLLVGASLAGAALGFLPWNVSSRIFLGDVGSYGIGALVATACVLAWGAGVPAALVLAPTLLYFADTGWVIIKRRRAGHHLTQAHREHVYQRLVTAGWPHFASASWNAGLAAIVCLLAAGLYDDDPIAAVLIAILLVLLYLAMPRFTAQSMSDRAGAA